MDVIAELEKYKGLLDEGAITEDEFRRMKQSLLGLKSDEEKEAERQAERDEALKEIEKLREKETAEKAEKERQEAIEQARLEAEQREREMKIAQQEAEMKAQQSFAEEKAKEKARLEAAREVEDEKRAKQKEKLQATSKAATSVMGIIVLWLLTLGSLLFAIGSIGAGYIITGIICLLWAVMACPLITSKTRDIAGLSVYYRYKKVIAIVLVVLFCVSLVI